MKQYVLSNKEKALLHIYKSAAGLSDPAYREILRCKAGCTSSTDAAMTWRGFKRSMATLETVLFDRVERGEIPDPVGSNRWIYKRTFWREQLDPEGMINSRQFHEINKLWSQLGEFMPDGQRTPQYLAGIVTRATGKHDVGFTGLTMSEAGLVIDALKDRLASAIREQQECPF